MWHQIFVELKMKTYKICHFDNFTGVIIKMVFFETLDSHELISRKIRVAENFLKSHTVILSSFLGGNLQARARHSHLERRWWRKIRHTSRQRETHLDRNAKRHSTLFTSGHRRKVGLPIAGQRWASKPIISGSDFRHRKWASFRKWRRRTSDGRWHP